MVTASKIENETLTAVAESASPAAAAVAPAAPVDVSAIPETPAELLKQWDGSRRTLAHTVFAATFGRVLNFLTGPGMTQKDRLNREIAEAKGFVNGYMKLA